MRSGANRPPGGVPLGRCQLTMALVRAELAGTPPSVVLQFLAWLVGYVRRPRRVWWEWTGEGWQEIE